MNKEYADIFKDRGSQYDQAMQLFPDARDKEFETLFDFVDLDSVNTLLDIPSGGGYIKSYLPENVEVTSLDPCSSFNSGSPHITANVDLEYLDLPENSFDMVVCVAAMHHIKNKYSFMQRCSNALKDQGVFLIGDVEKGSGIAHFLDEFVGTYSGHTHEGLYLDIEASLKMVSQLEMNVIDISVKACPWIFNCEVEMLQFCRLLFGLRKINDNELLRSLNKYIGVSKAGGDIHLYWELLYITLERSHFTISN